MVRMIPPSVIASWPAPNYVNPVRRGPEAVQITVAFISLASIAVFSRLYVHMFIIRSFGAEDVFIILAYLSTIAMTALEIVGYEHYAWGHHIWDVPLHNFSGSLYISWWYRIVYSTASCFTRMALLLFYYRIIRGGQTMKEFRRWIHLATLFSISVGITLLLTTIFQCNPIRAIWTVPVIQGSKCIDEGKANFACGIVNIMADTCVAVLPIPLIYKLRLPLRKRIGALMLISLGLLVCVVGVVRSYYVWFSLIHSYDRTWDGYGTLVAATIEIHVGLICACAPAIRLGIIKLIIPKLETIRYKLFSRFSPNEKLSTTKTPIPAPKQKRSFHPNRGTFLNSITPGSSDSELAFGVAPTSVTGETQKSEDIMDDKGFHMKDMLPAPPLKDAIYVMQEVQIKSSPALQVEDSEHTPQRWAVTNLVVDPISARDLGPQGDTRPLFLERQQSYRQRPPQPTYTGLTHDEWRDVNPAPGQAMTSSTSEFGESDHTLPERSGSQSRRKRSDTLQIPDRTFKLARERFSNG